MIRPSPGSPLLCETLPRRAAAIRRGNSEGFGLQAATCISYRPPPSISGIGHVCMPWGGARQPFEQLTFFSQEALQGLHCSNSGSSASILDRRSLAGQGHSLIISLIDWGPTSHILPPLPSSNGRPAELCKRGNEGQGKRGCSPCAGVGSRSPQISICLEFESSADRLRALSLGELRRFPTTVNCKGAGDSRGCRQQNTGTRAPPHALGMQDSIAGWGSHGLEARQGSSPLRGKGSHQMVVGYVPGGGRRAGADPKGERGRSSAAWLSLALTGCGCISDGRSRAAVTL